MDKLTFKEWSTLSDLQTIVNLKEDEEFSMARGELKTAKSAIERLMRHLKGEGNLEAWIQSKITKASDYLDTVADHMDSGEDQTKDVSEMISTSVETGRRFIDISSKKDQEDLEKERTEKKKEKQEKYKKSLESLRDETRKKGVRFYDKKGSGYIKDGQKHYDESVELLDANGNLFAHIVDIIKGSDYKFKSFTQPITEDAVEELESGLKKLDDTSYDSIDKLMRGIMKEHGMTAKELHNAFVKKHDKTPDDWIKELNEKCWDGYKQLGMKKKGKKVVPNCVKEDSVEEVYMFTPQKKSKDVSKKKETWYERDDRKSKEKKLRKESFELQEMGEVQRYCPKCKKNETASECRYGEGYWKMFSLPASLAPKKPHSIAKVHPANEVVIQPGQLTNEDYQRIQSTGNVYTILFSWRGRSMMNLQLFFPNMKRPSKDEVKAQIEKLYPGAVIMQWYPSPTDPTKPIVVIQDK